MAKKGIFNQPSPSKGKKPKYGLANNVASGDYYGTGVKNPIGKMRDNSMGRSPVSKKGLKVPPKSVA